MNNRTTGIIATVAAAILCGCPGIFLCIFGAWGATGTMPYTTTVNGVDSAGTTPAAAGFGMLCLALIFIAIPIVVGFFTLRNKPAAAATSTTPPPTPPSEPLPPAS